MKFACVKEAIRREVQEKLEPGYCFETKINRQNQDDSLMFYVQLDGEGLMASVRERHVDGWHEVYVARGENALHEGLGVLDFLAYKHEKLGEEKAFIQLNKPSQN